MPVVFSTQDTDNLVADYVAGVPMQKLARQAGVHVGVIKKTLLNAGVTLRPVLEVRRKGRLNLPVDAIVSAYVGGESELSIANRYGVNRWTIARILRISNVQRRNGSEANFLRMARLTPEERLALAANAHIAATGRTRTFREKCQHALTKYVNQDGISEYETLLAGWLREEGIVVWQQFPVGPYNLDIALHASAIAVEVYGGKWHAHGSHAARHPQRTKYLLNHGWSVLIIWVDTDRYPLDRAVCENILTFADELRSNPALGRQYRVILGNGQGAPALSSNLNDATMIERLSASE